MTNEQYDDGVFDDIVFDDTIYDDFTAQEQSDEYIPDWYDAREEYYDSFRD